MSMVMMDVKKVHECCQKDSVTLLDVRTPGEFKANHASYAKNWPLDQIDPDSIRQQFSPSDDRPLYVICQSGGRSQRACEKLAAAGLPVVNVIGGTSAWVAAGLPVEKSKGGTISIERQTRITAGGLACIGGILAALVDPRFGWIPAAMGGGLALAGVTDSCAMGMILLAMPWNRGSKPSQTCQT